MKTYRIEDFKGGWFIGNFEPSLLKNPFIEVCHKFHPAGEEWPRHYHYAVEINCVINGEMTVNGQLFKRGDVFIIESEEMAKAKFLTDVDLIVIKYPSNPNDKFETPE